MREDDLAASVERVPEQEWEFSYTVKVKESNTGTTSSGTIWVITNIPATPGR